MNHSRAIVLSRTDFGESDRYIQFFTEKWGVITTLAKAARKSRRRYAGGLDLFCHNDIYLRGDPRKGRPYLNELVVLNPFTDLRSDLDRMLGAGKITQWVRKLSEEGTPFPDIYRLLGQTLTLLSRETEPARMELLVLVFKIKLLSRLGLGPSSDPCSQCPGQRNLNFFDIAGGGMRCLDCPQKKDLKENLLLIPEEQTFLKEGDRLRLSQWAGVHFPPGHTLRLTRLMTHFASYHTNTGLPH